MSRQWALRITFLDVENNQFLELGGAAWLTKRERNAHLRTIPQSTGDSNFILDVLSAKGIEDTRLITRETVSRLLGRSAAVAIAEAREREAAAQTKSNTPGFQEGKS